MAKVNVPKTAMTGIGGDSPSFSDVVSGKSTETETPSVASGSVDHSCSGSSLQITIHKLNGKNYLEWYQSVKLAIDGH